LKKGILCISYFYFFSHKVSKVQPQLKFEPRHESRYETRQKLALEPRYKNVDDHHHVRLPIPQDNTLCDKSGGGGIVQLFIENGGNFFV